MNRASLLSLAVLALAACALPTPREIALQTSDDTKSLVREALETAQQTNGWSSVDRLFAQSPSSRPHLPESTTSDPVTEVITKYSDRIFADSNVVEKPLGAVIFGLPGSILCTGPDGTSTPSSQCVQQIDSLQLRLKVTAGIDLTLQVGPAHLEPIVLKLRSKSSVSVEEDLEATEKAVLFINTQLGTSSPTNGVTVSAKGRIELKLLRNGDHDFTVSQSNLLPVDVKYTDASGGVRSYVSEARSPVYSLRLEGPAGKATVLVDQGRFEAHALSTDFSSSVAVATADGGTTYQQAPTVPVALVVSGLSAQLTVQEGKDPVLTHVGLGDAQSTLTYDGRPLVKVDLNATMGRHFDVSAQPTSASTRVDVTPGVEVVVYTGFAALPSVYRPNPAFADTTWTGSFKSPAGSPSLQFVSGTQNASGFVRVLAGTLSLSSSQAGEAARTFAAGTCFAGGSSSSASPVLDVFSPVPCR